MRSGTPKVLHELCGRPMVLHVVDALGRDPRARTRGDRGGPRRRARRRDALSEQLVTEVPVEFVEQHVQRGTGDAVSVALTSSAFDDLDAEDDILVLPGRPAARCAPRRSRSSRSSTATRTRRRPSSPRTPPTRPATDVSSATRTIASPASSSTPTPTWRSSRSTRSTRRSTASAATSSRRRCAASAPRTRRASTT